jgi:histone acetyltransferase (RNA polymerase elongator complex component)
VPPLEEALAAKPDIYCVHYHLGMAYLTTGRIELGIQHLQNQVERRPGTREAVLAREELLRRSTPARTPS